MSLFLISRKVIPVKKYEAKSTSIPSTPTIVRANSPRTTPENMPLAKKSVAAAANYQKPRTSPHEIPEELINAETLTADKSVAIFTKYFGED